MTRPARPELFIAMLNYPTAHVMHPPHIAGARAFVTLRVLPAPLHSLANFLGIDVTALRPKPLSHQYAISRDGGTVEPSKRVSAKSPILIFIASPAPPVLQNTTLSFYVPIMTRAYNEFRPCDALCLSVSNLAPRVLLFPHPWVTPQ